MKEEIKDQDLKKVSGGWGSPDIDSDETPKFKIGDKIYFHGRDFTWEGEIVKVSTDKVHVSNWPKKGSYQFYYSIKYTGSIGSWLGSKTKDNIYEYRLMLRE